MDRIAVNKPVKTYSNTRKVASKIAEKPKKVVAAIKVPKKVPLTTKKALELLLSGKLRSSVCRYCLHIAQPLSELDQILQVGGRGELYSVTIRDMVASFHPFKVVDDINFPNKVCEKCLDHIIQSYLFAQQCEQSERAIRNCFDDMYEKLNKLDPIDCPKKRGRQKLNPNHNILYTEHRKVIDYAEPIRNLINSSSAMLTHESEMSELECKKCWQLLPNIESLVNHEKMHPSSMWYHCRTCGKSFPKQYLIKRHLRLRCKGKLLLPQTEKDFQCKQCGFVSEDYKIHLQHIEKHKFQMVLEHLVEGNTEKLCAVCLEKNRKMVDLDKMICLHGGFHELMGDRSLYNVLGSTVPEMNIISNYTSSKICEKCIDHAITSYIFINRTRYIRNRLDTCIINMLDKLDELNEPENKIFIEISQNSILPMEEQYDENLLLDELDDIDEAKLKVEVLEDEFRIKSESDEGSESDTKSDIMNVKEENTINKTNTQKLVNGYTITKNNIDVCSEFLTFKKKKPFIKRHCKFTCPLCNKHFISEHYLKRHVLKHINKKVECKICNYHFKSKFNLFEHIKMTHLFNGKTRYSCNTCGRMFEKDTKRLAHEKCHLARFCELCSKTFVSLKHHDTHMQRHAMKLNILSRKKQTCSFCEKECLDDNQLSVHVNKVHLQIKPYGCDMCDRQFYTETNLRQHKKVHSILSKETCEFCMKTLKCRRDFVVHLRKHIGVRPFKCMLCSQEFYSEIEMKSHMKKWHGGRFCCKLCRKVFINRTGLKNHVNIAHSVF